ncbi:MAG: hypothetical protein ACPGYT_15405 [Nitrospirales bacterium]
MKKTRLPIWQQIFLFGAVVSLQALPGIWDETASAARPFWTKTPSYIEGEFVYVVGTVSQIPSLADAKQQALVHGKLELMNFAKISEVSAEGLTLETRHTYVEKNPDSSVNVFQLLRIPASRVLELQARLHAQRKIQAEKLDVSQQRLSNVHTVLIARQQTIDEQTASIDAVIQRITKKQTTYKQKTQEIDQRELEITQLKLTLEEKFVAIDDQIQQVNQLLQQYKTKGDAQAIELKKLKEVESTIEESEAEIQGIQQAILARLQKTANMACRLISPGMAPDDVKKVLGAPAGEKHSYANERYDTWAYGTAKINFDAQGVVESVSECNKADAPLLEKDTPSN